MAQRGKNVYQLIKKEKVIVNILFQIISLLKSSYYRLCPIPEQTINKREFKREREKTIWDLKTFVLEMLKKESWQQPCQRNSQVFPRYAKDQCLKAKSYFKKQDIKIKILHNAFLFCPKNDIHSPANFNLKGTCICFNREEETSKTLLKEKELPVPLYQGEHFPFKISQRSLSAYQGLITKREVVYESLSTGLELIRHPKTKRISSPSG